MAILTRDTKLAQGGLETIQAMFVPQLSGNLFAGEDLRAVAPCYQAADGMFYECVGAANDEKAVISGWTGKLYKAGETITLYGLGAIFHFSNAALTPGQLVYMGAAAGDLDDAQQTGHPGAIAQAFTANEIRVVVNL